MWVSQSLGINLQFGVENYAGQQSKHKRLPLVDGSVEFDLIG